MGYELLSEEMLVLNLGLLLVLGGACSLIFKKFKMPVVIGYLVSGIIIAYFGWNSVETMDIVELLSDIGLALLMFCIGMELNLKKLKKMGSFAILVVAIQVPIILIGGVVLGQLILGLDSIQAIIFAAVISGSSTAVVTIVLGDQKNMSRSDVESLILVTVVEDVFQVVILSAITPLMQGSTMAPTDLAWLMTIIIVFMVSQVVIGIALLPRFLDWIHKKMPAEVLVIISLGFCFGLSFLSVKIGMSMAIGQFLAGVVVSQAKSSKDIEEKVTPMKDVFMMMFFISIGMQISLPSLVDNIVLIIAIYLIYFLLKFSSVILAYFVGNKTMALAYHSSIALVAMGEFAFIISKEALDAGIFSQNLYTSIVGAALVSMIVLPIVNKQNDKVIRAVSTKQPARLQNAYHRLDVKRGVLYNRLSVMSTSSMNSLKNKLASIYINIIAIIVLEVVFFFMSNKLIQFLDSHTSAAVTPALQALLILLMEFLILLLPVRSLVVYIKYVFRVYLDSVRRAMAAGERRTARAAPLIRVIARTDTKYLTVIFQFAITMIVPIGVDIIGRLIMLGLGVLIISLVSAYRYMMRE